MGDFDDILKKKLNQMGIGRQVEAVGVVERATTAIAKIIPQEDFEVISFNRGTLKVKVANSAVASELRMNVSKIKIKEIKKTLFLLS
jgi:hypothetical protein